MHPETGDYQFPAMMEIKVDIPTAIKKLEEEWDVVNLTGFFGQLKMGVYDEEGFLRVRNILDSLKVPDGEELDKRFVELTWFIPTFLHWQKWGWSQDGKDTQDLDRAISFFEQRLTTILGLP